MRWNRYRLQILAEAEDIVAATLAEAGVEGVEIEDKQPLTEDDIRQMFVDIPPEQPEDDGLAWLSFYIEEEEDDSTLLRNVQEALDELRTFTDIGPCVLEKTQTEDKDWINNWKEYFHQFYVDDILIIPSWEEMKEEDSDKLVLHIDPGTAFGTGLHETTQLCLRQLKKIVTPGCSLLDVGTGSGILSIAALKMGAGHAVGTDLDPCAITATKENLQTNGLTEDKMDVLIGNLIDDPQVQEQAGLERFDIVIANIQAEVLIPLTPQAVRHMKKGAVYITSGILDVKEKAFIDAAEAAGLVVEEVTRQGEWVSVTARKVL